MLRTVYHVVGFTQYMGTCKMHLFKDCPQLMKKRVRHCKWGDSISTGCITETEWEPIPRHTCKLCVKREVSGHDTGQTGD